MGVSSAEINDALRQIREEQEEMHLGGGHIPMMASFADAEEMKSY
jgi:hypothetical protein